MPMATYNYSHDIQYITITQIGDNERETTFKI